MAVSLGLTAYRALARRGDDTPPDLSTPRPSGELLWVHLGEASNRLAVTDMARRVAELRDGLNVLLTLPKDSKPEEDTSLPGDGVLIERAMPSENPAYVDLFLKHWTPDVCIWSWGRLRPNLIVSAAETGAAMFLVDADSTGFDGRRDRWLPELSRLLLGSFRTVLARDSATVTRMAKLGVADDCLKQSEPLQPIGHALTADDTDIADLSEAVAGRTVWFANGVQPDELQMVLSAHRMALRRTHRLLLVIRTGPDLDPGKAMQATQENDFRVADWDGGEYPDETTQVLIAQDPKDTGLFYRVSPVSLMGGTLRTGGCGVDPFQAAALGSAVLYGPKVGRFVSSYTQLAAAGAARIVNDADGLGSAVAQLIRPEQAALMAHAGWAAISEGAEVADEISGLVNAALDEALP